MTNRMGWLRGSALAFLIVLSSIGGGAQGRAPSDPALLKDVFPGPSPASSMPFDFTPFKGFAYFGTSGDARGGELWRTKGTRASPLVPK